MGIAVTHNAEKTQKVLLTDPSGAAGGLAEKAVAEGPSAGVSMLWNVGGPVRLVIAAIVALQVLVPLIQLGAPPARFGFQMYSGLGGAQIGALDAKGDAVNIDHKKIVAGGLRPDLLWVQRLPEAVCERVPAAAQVVVTQGSEKRTLSCEP